MVCLQVFFIRTSLIHAHFSVQRLMTCRVSTTGSQTKFLRSVDLDVVTTLLAKKVVLLARKLEDVTSVIAHLQVLLSQPPHHRKTKKKRAHPPPSFQKIQT